MEYRGFIITNRTYGPSSPRVYAALRPRTTKGLFGDLIATSTSEQGIERAVDVYLAERRPGRL